MQIPLKLSEVLHDGIQQVQINLENHISLSAKHEIYVASHTICPTPDQTRSKTKRTLSSGGIAGGELHLMSHTLQQFQRRLAALSLLSERLFHSETLRPGDIHSIVSRFSCIRSQSGQDDTGAKMESDLSVWRRTALESGSSAKEISSYSKESKPEKKVEDRDKFIKLLTVFMEDYEHFKGCVEVALSSANNVPSEAQGMQASASSHAVQDSKKDSSQEKNYPVNKSDMVPFTNAMALHKEPDVDKALSKVSDWSRFAKKDEDVTGWSSDSSESDTDELICKMLVPNLK
ncbi:uncharacterized protein MELLADRAFT_68429 [Melampsora larici-populina 98AG31]|uniref:Uncharacterized protein n=1 Tax=Melampsora larici-populina (strain 98AG31 / pathotype 3-4-7) TaxID=747676 RepID=F4S6T2_MELLP|nr:uncharacterized protein MELLADRAFT_68429 [Melampsora larici-populina 98AG31]EGF99664.1 hypothetical protein MELLADRAFT_68429 [Melampsora larici-populina 98AG31]